MDNVKFVEIETIGKVETFAVIDNGDGTITTMLKSYWDEQQKAAELGGTL